MYDALTLPPQVNEPALVRFYDYWRSKCVDGRLPGRRDIDPMEIPDLLGWIMLVDVEREVDRLRFVYRLWGSSLTDLFGGDFTGTYVDKYPLQPAKDDIQRAFESAVNGPKAHYWMREVSADIGAPSRYARLILPLAGNGEGIDKLIGCFVRVEPARA